MALLLYFLQAHVPPADLQPPLFYTTENLISVLIGVITLTSGIAIWFIQKAIARAETREEKVDALLIEIKKDITVLQKDSSIHTYSYSTVDRRLEKLETWKEQVQNNHKG